MDNASLVFLQNHNLNISLFNSLIKGTHLYGPFEEAITLFTLIKAHGIWPNEYTEFGLMNTRFRLCLRHVLVLVIYSGRIEEAKKVFDGMSKRGVIVWNLMIRGFCKRGDVDAGLNLFSQMSERSVVSWNSMISFKKTHLFELLLAEEDLEEEADIEALVSLYISSS
ncbi:hypothetical protein REPUB_Repub06bG0007700 [Reevesia pubescens]